MRSIWGGLMAVLMSGAVAQACGSPEEILDSMLEERARLVAEGQPVAELDAAIDAHAGQRDAWASGLYWYRDLAEAQAVAEYTGRPILSLRLLGKLDCDLSCANSRFFRTVLYANTDVAKLLREQFVLHWESVRPVPVVTIDMGDGRVLKRTVTGNSIHYVLTADGRIVDALPGLYGPARFMEQLREAREAVRLAAGAADPADAIRTHQAARLAALERELARWFGRAGIPTRGDGERGAGNPSAAEAAPRAMGKMVVEAPLVRATTGEDPADPFDLGAATGAVQLDAGSRALMQTKLAPERREGQAFAAVVARFEAVVARDQAQNELELRPRILRQLLATAPAVDALNRWVYAEVFLTPDQDPWLGLDAGGAYAALDGGGVVLDD